MSKVVLVCGGRGWTDELSVHAELCRLRREGFTRVVHGGARGADTMAGNSARLLGFSVVEVPAQWHRYGKPAGMIRNAEMLRHEPELVVAFHANLRQSRGTGHMVRLAQGRGIPVRVITNGTPEFPTAFFAKKAGKETLQEGGRA
jgi:hypothetical protein